MTHRTTSTWSILTFVLLASGCAGASPGCTSDEACETADGCRGVARCVDGEPLACVCATDGGPLSETDGGLSDAGTDPMPDAGPQDSGTLADAAPPIDAALQDAGASDGGTDAGASDGGSDAGPPDAGPPPVCTTPAPPSGFTMSDCYVYNRTNMCTTSTFRNARPGSDGAVPFEEAFGGAFPNPVGSSQQVMMEDGTISSFSFDAPASGSGSIATINHACSTDVSYRMSISSCPGDLEVDAACRRQGTTFPIRWSAGAGAGCPLVPGRRYYLNFEAPPCPDTANTFQCFGTSSPRCQSLMEFANL